MSGIVLAPVSGYKESRDVSLHFEDIYTGAEEKDVVTYGSCIDCASSMCQAMCDPPNNTEFMPFHSSVCRETNEQPWCEVKIGREVPWYSLTISIPLFVSHGVGVGTNFNIMPHVKGDALGSQTGSVALKL